MWKDNRAGTSEVIRNNEIFIKMEWLFTEKKNDDDVENKMMEYLMWSPKVTFTLCRIWKWHRCKFY